MAKFTALLKKFCRFLAEIGALHLVDDDCMPFPLKDIYTKLQEKKNGYSWEFFEAYKHLKTLGYVVGRHGIPWTMKTSKVNLSAEGLSDMNKKVDGESRGSFVITEMFSCIEVNEVRPVFDVYPPDSQFKKSSPCTPCFVIYLSSSGHPPSKQEIGILRDVAAVAR